MKEELQPRPLETLYRLHQNIIDELPDDEEYDDQLKNHHLSEVERRAITAAIKHMCNRPKLSYKRDGVPYSIIRLISHSGEVSYSLLPRGKLPNSVFAIADMTYPKQYGNNPSKNKYHYPLTLDRDGLYQFNKKRNGENEVRALKITAIPRLPGHENGFVRRYYKMALKEQFVIAMLHQSYLGQMRRRNKSNYFCIYTDSPLHAGRDLFYQCQQPDYAFNISYLMLMMRSLIAQVATLHQLGFHHRDIKHENVMFSFKKLAKLIDFAFTTTKPKKSCKGTPSFMAPEVFLETQFAGKPADVFALGCILFETFGGIRIPEYAKYPNGFHIPDYESFGKAHAFLDQEDRSDLINLINIMIAFDPDDRPTLDQCISQFSEVSDKYLDPFIVNQSQFYAACKKAVDSPDSKSFVEIQKIYLQKLQKFDFKILLNQTIFFDAIVMLITSGYLSNLQSLITEHTNTVKPKQLKQQLEEAIVLRNTNLLIRTVLQGSNCIDDNCLCIALKLSPTESDFIDNEQYRIFIEFLCHCIIAECGLHNFHRQVLELYSIKTEDIPCTPYQQLALIRIINACQSRITRSTQRYFDTNYETSSTTSDSSSSM